MELWFHDVAVVVETGGNLFEATFGDALLPVPFSTRPPASGPTIRIRLTEAEGALLPPDAAQMDEDERGLPRMFEAGVEAIVDLDALTIDLRRWRAAHTALPSARTSTLIWAVSLALRELGIVPLHAAALVHAQRSIIIAGDSGAGKTTTALALVSAGCASLNDDHVFLRRRGAEWEVLAAPGSFRVTPRTLAAYSHLGTIGDALNDLGKHEFMPKAVEPQRDRFQGEVRLLFPRRHSSETKVSAMSTATAVGELMVASPIVAIGGEARARRHAALLAELASTSRPRQLDLGSELLERPELGGRELLRLLDDPSFS